MWGRKEGQKGRRKVGRKVGRSMYSCCCERYCKTERATVDLFGLWRFTYVAPMLHYLKYPWIGLLSARPWHFFRLLCASLPCLNVWTALYVIHPADPNIWKLSQQIPEKAALTMKKHLLSMHISFWLWHSHIWETSPSSLFPSSSPSSPLGLKN